MSQELDFNKVVVEINKLLKKTRKEEVITGSDDAPMALNILKLLRIYDTGQFYGTVSIKIVGVSPRNLKINEQSFKLLEENLEFFLDK